MPRPQAEQRWLWGVLEGRDTFGGLATGPKRPRASRGGARGLSEAFWAQEVPEEGSEPSEDASEAFFLTD